MNYPEKIQCKKCGEFKTHEHYNFFKDGKRKGYIQYTICRECLFIRGKEYRIKNRENIKLSKKRDYSKNKERYIKKAVEWNRDNWDKVKEQRIKNKENIIKSKKKEYKKNRERYILSRKEYWKKNRIIMIKKNKKRHEYYRNNLTDSYIKDIYRSDYGIYNPSNELIESKRQQILNKRLLKQLKTKLNDKLESGKQ